MNCESLQDFLLSKNISKYAVDKLKEDGIDSETFLELDPTLMYAMGIKMADCIKLHKIIPEVKSLCKEGMHSSVLSDGDCTSIIPMPITPVSCKDLEAATSPVINVQPHQLTAENILQPMPSRSSSQTSRKSLVLTLVNSSVNTSPAVSSPSAPSYPGELAYNCSVREVLTASDAGRRVISEYESTGMVIRYKHTMVQLLVADLIAKCGTLYPPSSAKASLAHALVSDFPRLRGIGTLGYEQYYSPFQQIVVPGQNKIKKVSPHGHIEERLKTIRKNEGVRIRAKRPRMEEEPLETPAPFSEEERIMINELRFHDIGVERQADIMEATFPSRQKWILKSRPTFSDVCGRFPPLNELHLAFQKEFMRWCPGAADFLVQWEDMSPKVLAFAEKRSNPMVKVLLDELKEFSPCTQNIEMEYAVHLLPYILTAPLRKTKRYSANEASEHFIHMSPTMVSMETVLEDLKGGNKQHPMLVAKGSRGAVEQVYLTVEGQAIEIERGGLLFGLEKLMKVYFIMQMAYPPECLHVLQFLQNAVLSVNDGVPMTCRSALDLTQYVRSGRK